MKKPKKDIIYIIIALLIAIVLIKDGERRNNQTEGALGYIFLGILLIGLFISHIKKNFTIEIPFPFENEIEEPEEPEQPQIPLYEKKAFLTANERTYQEAIQRSLPPGYKLFPQICLASVIQKNYNNTFANELFRIIDFGIFDENYTPIVVIEINDSSHYESHRIARDYKVKDLLEQANIPLITLWTSYGINEEYIEKRINEYCQ